MQLIAALEPETIALVMAACFFAAALSGLSGFGAGLLIALAITPIIGAKAVVPALSVVMLITNFSRVVFFWTTLDLKVLALVVATALPTSVLGAMVYVELDGELVRALLGSVLILSIPLRRWIAGRELVAGPAALLSFGAGFGFLSSILVGAGILVIPMLLGAGLAGPALLATDAAIAVVVNIVKIVAFGRLDALDLPLLVAALAMGLCTVPGTWVAAWIVRRTDIRVHTVMMELIVMLGGTLILFVVLG
jgi:uncharacterized protein